MYLKAADACAKLRAQNGNCGLLAISIDTRAEGGVPGVFMRGKATLGILQRRAGG